jgi:outer membrane protein assembly factor BamB
MRKAILIFGWLLLAIVCKADIITVDDDGPADFNNIQAAINDANDGDIIYVFPGRYTGAGNRDIDFDGRAITVQSVLPEDPYIVAATIIDCNGAGRGFNFHNREEANSVLDGLTITNGAASGGAGVVCNSSHPTVSNCVITGNWARSTYVARGGGVHCSYSNATFTNCTISGNSAGGISDVHTYGGGVYCVGRSPRFINCTIANNLARAVESYGGGIYSSSSAMIINCTISGNRVEGAMYVRGSGGGGIYSEGVGRVIGCELNGNSAANGGAVYYGWSNQSLTSCTLSGNWASVNGGGIYCISSVAVIKNCTLSSNVASSAGGGMYTDRGNPQVTNCILWGNADANGIVESAQIDGDIPEVTFSCIQDDNPDDAYIPFGGDANSNIDDNPMFVREPYDGGDGWGVGDNDDFGDLHLQDASPCVNVGDPSTWFQPNSVDIDGEPRVMAGIVDMGADEVLIPTIAVTRPEGGEVWTTGSIHEIRWYSLFVSGLVDVTFSGDGGGSWQTIESGIGDTGSYMCQLPDKADSNECVISVVPGVPDANVVCIASGLFTVQHYPERPAVPPGQIGKWDNFRRTGLSENYGPQSGCVKWQFETDGAISASVTIGPNGTVYVPCEDGRLYKLNADGALLWSYDANTPLISSPALGYHGMVYVGGKNGKLYAIDGGGKLRWTHRTEGFIYSSPAVSADGDIYVCSQDGKVYGLGPDGSELWSFETAGFGMLDGAIFASPTIGADGTIYIAGLYDPNLYALDPNDGSVKWVCHFESGGWPFASLVVAADSTIYQTLLHDPNLYAIDPNNGSIIWVSDMADTESGLFEPYYYDRVWFDERLCDYVYRGAKYDVSSSGWSKPALGPDGTIYVSFDDPFLRAVDPNGTIKWVTKPGSSSGFTLTVGSNGLIYAASDEGHLYMVNPDGETVRQQ